MDTTPIILLLVGVVLLVASKRSANERMGEIGKRVAMGFALAALVLAIAGLFEG